MKKIIASLLALLCIFAFASCFTIGEPGDGPGGASGTDDTLTMLQDAYESDAAYAEGEVKIISPDGKTTKEFAAILNPDDEVYELSIPYYEYMSVDDKGNVIMPDDIEGNITGNPDSNASSVTVGGYTFDKAYFKDGNYTFDGKKFQATIINCTGFFGTELTQAEVDVTLTLANDMPKKVTIEYTTALGYEVEINITYNY